MKPQSNSSFFRWIERISFVLILAAGGYAVFLFRQPAELPAMAPVVNAEAVSGVSLVGEVVPEDVFSQMVEGRDIFSSPMVAPVPASETLLSTQQRAVDILPDHIKIVAIVQGGTPEVVVEDMNRKKTFFLKPGADGKDGFKVESLSAGRLLLNHQGTNYVISIGQ